MVELGERQIAWDKKFKEGRGEELSDSLMDHLSLKSDGRSGASLASGKLSKLHQGVEHQSGNLSPHTRVREWKQGEHV